ncbi:MAG: hypothetical protein HY040_16705 [Planctomycetes bacterium]|nr:hypothetical protein [Planctomycetota bacterium]
MKLQVMNKQVMFWAVVGTICSFGSLQAQAPGDEKIPPPTVQEAAPRAYVEIPQTGLSNWITYHRENCCFGNVGGDTPIGTELFLRIGPSVPIGSNFLRHILNTGWMIEGGGRSMFFNPSMEAAWFVEFSISNTNNHSGPEVQIFTPRLATNPVVVQSYNRTFVNLGAGREWYLFPATDTGRNWRTGLDLGVRYGSASLGLYNTQHLTDVVGGWYASWHTDLEFPFCCCHNPCIFQAGFRVEYGYTWSDILGHSTDLQDLNLLFSFGVRY